MYSNLEENQKAEQFISCRVILVGESGVGKTSLLSKYVKGIFPQNPQSTVALEFCTKMLKMKDDTNVKVQLFDTAGQERYRSLVSNYYRKALGALLVFDLTRRDTFVAVKRFLEDIRYNAEPDCVVYLIGNKFDLITNNEKPREITSDEAKAFANENQIYYMETSAVSNFKVSEAFECLVEKVFQEKIKNVQISQRMENIDIGKRKRTDESQGGCCS